MIPSNAYSLKIILIYNLFTCPNVFESTYKNTKCHLCVCPRRVWGNDGGDVKMGCCITILTHILSPKLNTKETTTMTIENGVLCNYFTSRFLIQFCSRFPTLEVLDIVIEIQTCHDLAFRIGGNTPPIFRFVISPAIPFTIPPSPCDTVCNTPSPVPRQKSKFDNLM